jgi:hypothetical protein
MDDETTIGMAPSLHSYIGRDPRKLVHRPRYVQRHYIMENITTEFCSNLLI